jgi:hypothetical protein
LAEASAWRGSVADVDPEADVDADVEADVEADDEESIAVLERQSRQEPSCSATVHQSPIPVNAPNPSPERAVFH